MAALRTAASVARVLAPKVTGTRVLAELFGPPAGEPAAAPAGPRPAGLVAADGLDFFALCTSAAAYAGRPGRVEACAGEAYLDAFAAAHPHLPAVALAWPEPWESLDGAAGEVLRRALGPAQRRPAVRQVLVSPRAPAATFARLLRPAEAPAAERLAAAAAVPADLARHRRPALATAYAAPRSATEQRLAELWTELLGVAPVGLHDDFLELGGHSLLATQMLARLRGDLGVEVPIAVFFERPTVAGLASFAAATAAAGALSPITAESLADLIAEVGNLSPAEVEALLAEEQDELGGRDQR